MKTIIIQVSPDIDHGWGTFKKCCEEKEWVYQTLYNSGLVPKVGKSVKIKDCELHRIIVK
ncbi:MAG TPA: hypothetical protein VN192_01275 [Flavobacterium sp.]|nr:hypothetical protein [Flavobacterium sp.]